MKCLLLLLLSVPAFAQLPDHGDIADLKGKTRVYIVADGDAYTAINKAVAKRLTVVSKSADAEFFLEYKTISRTTNPIAGFTLENGQLDAYVLQDKSRLVAWSDHLTGGGFKGDTAKQLAQRFIKVLTKPQR